LTNGADKHAWPQRANDTGLAISEGYDLEGRLLEKAAKAVTDALATTAPRGNAEGQQKQIDRSGLLVHRQSPEARAFEQNETKILPPDGSEASKDVGPAGVPGKFVQGRSPEAGAFGPNEERDDTDGDPGRTGGPGGKLVQETNPEGKAFWLDESKGLHKIRGEADSEEGDEKLQPNELADDADSHAVGLPGDLSPPSVTDFTPSVLPVGMSIIPTIATGLLIGSAATAFGFYSYKRSMRSLFTANTEMAYGKVVGYDEETLMRFGSFCQCEGSMLANPVVALHIVILWALACGSFPLSHIALFILLYGAFV
jgi:hypothetical protein